MSYQLRLSRQATKDWEHIQSLGEHHALYRHAAELHRLLSRNPWQTPPPLKKLQGKLSDCVARRLNQKHRLVYQVHEEAKVVFIMAMAGHYDDN